MKTTGMVRRIDELGRVVIPKEIRKTMRIKEGEELEVLVDENDGLVLRKYSTLKAMSEFAEELCDALSQVTGNTTFVCDNDVIIASSEGKLIGKRISNKLENTIDNRKSVFLQGREGFSLFENSESANSLGVTPIIHNGDIMGAVVMFSYTRMMGEGILHLLKVSATFLDKQI